MVSGKLERRLKESHLIRITTFNASGKPGTVPMWFYYDNGEVYVNTSKSSEKVKKLKQNKNVIITVGLDDSERFEGTADLIKSDTREFNETIRLLYEKYGSEARKQWGEPTRDTLKRIAEQRVILRITPKKQKTI